MKPSRRNFLFTAVAAPLAARLDPLGQSAYEVRAAGLPAGQMHFDNPQLLRYDAKCFTINGKSNTYLLKIYINMATAITVPFQGILKNVLFFIPLKIFKSS